MVEIGISAQLRDQDPDRPLSLWVALDAGHQNTASPQPASPQPRPEPEAEPSPPGPAAEAAR